MRPVRFVALSEDGQALVLADEVGRLLALPLDERVATAVSTDGTEPDQPASGRGESTGDAATGSSSRDDTPSSRPGAMTGNLTLSPRDIQARIRTGESAEDIARSAGVAVDRVLRYAGPVLQERAMLAQAARRARLSTSERGERLSEVVDVKLAQHGVDAEAVSWDAWRREDGGWRVQASWASGKATATATWQLDRSRQSVSPHDEMSQFLSTPAPAGPRSESVRLDTGRVEAPRAEPTNTAEPTRPSRDPLYGVRPRGERDRDEDRNSSDDPLRRDALRAVLERPLGDPRGSNRSASPLGLPGTEAPEQRDSPSVPSLAVLRPRRNDHQQDDDHEDGDQPSLAAVGATADAKPRNRLPAWDDVLFGSASPRSSKD